jgi:hypothetical protein
MWEPGPMPRLRWDLQQAGRRRWWNTDDSPNHNCTTEVLSWLPSLSRDPFAGVAVFSSILPVSAAR